MTITAYCYTLKDKSDSNIELMDIVYSPDIHSAFSLILDNIKLLNSVQQDYVWTLARIEHGHFTGVETTQTNNCRCDDCDNDCDNDCENDHCNCDDFDEEHDMPF